MKLTELNPRWLGFPGPIYDGVSFDCPHCKTQRLAVTFTPPIDPNGWWDRINRPTYKNRNIWSRKGDTFETISLSPSIDNSRIDAEGHWHGYIINGEIV